MTDAVIAPSGISPDIIDRLRAEATTRRAVSSAELLDEAAAEIAILRALILRLEAELALHCGTIAGNQWEGPATGFTVTHNVPPNAPPHGETAE